MTADHPSDDRSHNDSALSVGDYVMFDGSICRVDRVELAPTYWLIDMHDPDDQYDLGPTVVADDDERLAPVPTLKREGA